MADAATNVAYRVVLRLCRSLERRSTEAVLLLGRPPRWFVPPLNRIVRPPIQWPFVGDAVKDACGGATEFAHPSARAAQRAARKHRRLAESLGLDYICEARVFQRQLERAREIAAEVDGLLADAAGTQDATSPSSSVQRSSGVQLQRLPAGDSISVAIGDVLLAHPLSCISSAIFDRAAIVLDQVDELGEAVRGVVLNKPAGGTLRELVSSWPVDQRLWADSLGPLLDIPFYHGGPVLGPSLQDFTTWLHISNGAIPQSREVAPSLWIGGDPVAVGALAVKDPGKVRVLVGYAGWSGIQLTNELERGVWVRARPAANDMVMAELLLGSSEEARIWRDVMLAADMPLLAQFPRRRDIDVKIGDFVAAHHAACMEDLQRDFKAETSRS